MSITSHPNTSSELDEKRLEQLRKYWIADNPGALAAIAKDLGFSRTFVGGVFRKRDKSAGYRVESRLAELGAPGYEGFVPPEDTSNAA